MKLSTLAALAFVLASVLPATFTKAAEQADVQATPAEPSPQKSADPEADLKLREAIAHGATIEEIAKLKGPTTKTPQDAIRALKMGNARFFSGTTRRPDMSANERRAQILQQTPFAVVLGCSDSRVPVELVYDQGLGDIFSVRVAGQVMEPGTSGSIEYAIKHLNTKLLVIMGHEGCGAVKAAMLDEAERKAEPENVRYLLDRIVPAVSDIAKIRDPKAKMREAVIANVRKQVGLALQNPIIKAAVAKNELAVIGAFYEISSGQVDFLENEDDTKVH